MNNNVDSMLEAVSSKLGITPQRLKEAEGRYFDSTRKNAGKRRKKAKKHTRKPGAYQKNDEIRTGTGAEKIYEKSVMDGGQYE